MAGESNFVDYVKVYCRSGKGGRGSVHLRREKFVPKGGPDGGDGGDGGSIYIRANRNYWTLLHLRYNRHVIAQDGSPGSGALKTGAAGEDIIIDVPCGTTVHNVETGEFILDATEHDKLYLLLPGGRGGKGNNFFKSPTNQTPRYAQPGEPAQEMEVLLQLKVLADVGLVGFPNAGKSTLLASISAAKPKIANYPFTTLEPNLGMVAYRDNQSFVMADIPGIIEGASEGRGLGLRFLRHIERNSILLFVIPIDTPNITKEYEVLTQELERYNPDLLNKQKLLAITKIDLADRELVEMTQEALELDIPVVFISAVAETGLMVLKDKIWETLQKPSLYEYEAVAKRPLRESIADEEGDGDWQAAEWMSATGAKSQNLSEDIEWDSDMMNE